MLPKTHFVTAKKIGMHVYKHTQKCLKKHMFISTMKNKRDVYMYTGKKNQ
jgi:hypothetical protein